MAYISHPWNVVFIANQCDMLALFLTIVKANVNKQPLKIFEQPLKIFEQPLKIFVPLIVFYTM